MARRGRGSEVRRRFIAVGLCLRDTGEPKGSAFVGMLVLLSPSVLGLLIFQASVAATHVQS